VTSGLEGRKTEKSLWRKSHERPIRLRLPSLLNIGTANTLRLLCPRVQPGSRVLEIGFAPGKILAYLAARRNAIVSGVDYSDIGVAAAERLFRHLGLSADLRCEDLFSSTLPEESFDVVYSLGFIEHFENAAAVVGQHFRYLAPHGRAVIAIPNYGGIYGKLQSLLDPDNLEIHNLAIMQQSALRALVEGLPVSDLEAYAFGRLNTGLLSFERRFPGLASNGLHAAGNLLGLLQPVDISALCPLLVLEFKRRPM
jgi:2-polyprenyl-3-methyl-5-hydroxy-6-metoxy-1,4-benzoquinol methylase